MKGSGMLQKMELRHKAELEATRFATRQEMCDLARIALNRQFGFGPERVKRFMESLNELALEVAGMIDQDTKDAEYSMEKFEEALRYVDGPYYRPREERYEY